MGERRPFDYEIELGKLRGKTFRLGSRLNDINNPTDTAIVLIAYPDEEEIARIDWSESEEPHIHKFWRDKDVKEKLSWRGHPTKLWGMALTLFEKKWKDYARYYYK